MLDLASRFEAKKKTRKKRGGVDQGQICSGVSFANPDKLASPTGRN